jgi:hypothetical protein
MTQEEIVNKVAKSGLVTIDMQDWLPTANQIEIIDLKDYLFQGIVLKEKDFRDTLKETDWSAYKDKYVAIHCSTDAIIPTWAYMLLVTKLMEVTPHVFYGDAKTIYAEIVNQEISVLDEEEYREAKVVIKGCSKVELSPKAYILLTQKLQAVAKAIMFGEPCSTVPVFKAKKK